MSIKTFIFLDCETTGLPNQENNETRITELCLTAVESEHIMLGTPRIQNKINLCFNPGKMIDPSASKVSGLSNDLLKNQPVFSSTTVGLIREFIGVQCQPVCFVAHNGNHFDYPILRSEIHRTGQELAGEVLCIDSLEVFRELLGPNYSFKLSNLYKQLTLKEPTDAHQADYDVLMLIECAATVGQKFVEWSNRNATRFCDIPIMQPGRAI